MQLLRLKLVNFRQHELTELEFGPGMMAIIGPNGAGKSTLLEAIAFALYGVPATRGSKESLRRRGALPRSRFEVTLDFALGAHRYGITRTLTSAELTQDGQAIANSTGAVTERVGSLLGMSRDEFFNTYFTGQKELAVMAAMGKTERAQFLSRVLGYERLREAQVLLREQRSALRSELAGIEQGLGDPAVLETELLQVTSALETARVERDRAYAAEQAAEARRTALAPEWDAAQTRRTAWQSLDGERRVAEARVASTRAAFSALDRDLAIAIRARDRRVEIAAAVAEHEVLAAERAALDAAATAYTARSRSVARRDQARQRLVELEPQLAALPDAARVAALATARQAVVAAREAAERAHAELRTRWAQDAQEAKTRLEAFRDRYRELRDQVSLITEQGPEGKCPTCLRPLGKDFPETVALLERQMEELRIDGQYMGQRVEQLEDAPPEVREAEVERQRLEGELRTATETLGQAQAQLRQRAVLESERQRLGEELARIESELSSDVAAYDAARHQAVRTRVAELDPLRREHDQLGGIAARAEQLLANSTVAEQQATAAELELAALDERLAVVAWNPDEFAAIERSVVEADAALQAARIEVARASTAVDGAERMREATLARQSDRAEKAQVARRLDARIGLFDELDGAFTELRTELNLQLRPDLAERASTLLRDLTNGRYTDLDLDESYVPTIVEDGEAKPVISGGEEDVVNLALRLAISQMIAERAGQPLSLLVLDEIFGSLDEERRAAVLDLLRSLSDRFPQVILITHVEGMGDVFDRVLRMSYDVEKGITLIRDETPETVDVAA
jgi:exonuclease SbcC